MTFGSPRVTREAPGVTYRRFSSIGDPIPEITRTLRVYRPASQLYVDDRCASDRGRALVEERERLQAQLAPGNNPFEPPALVIAPQLAAIFPGAVEAHMAYPCIQDLDRYDALGAISNEERTSLQLDLKTAQYLAAPRPFLDAPAY